LLSLRSQSLAILSASLKTKDFFKMYGK
jgi:hypothetical protein